MIWRGHPTFEPQPQTRRRRRPARRLSATRRGRRSSTRAAAARSRSASSPTAPAGRRRARRARHRPPRRRRDRGRQRPRLRGRAVRRARRRRGRREREPGADGPGADPPLRHRQAEARVHRRAVRRRRPRGVRRHRDPARPPGRRCSRPRGPGPPGERRTIRRCCSRPAARPACRSSRCTRTPARRRSWTRSRYAPTGRLAPADVVAIAIPFPHLFGSAILTHALRNGASVVTLPTFELEEFLRMLDDYAVDRRPGDAAAGGGAGAAPADRPARPLGAAAA